MGQAIQLLWALVSPSVTGMAGHQETLDFLQIIQFYDLK
jgi:hypothetical protein